MSNQNVLSFKSHKDKIDDIRFFDPYSSPLYRLTARQVMVLCNKGPSVIYALVNFEGLDINMDLPFYTSILHIAASYADPFLIETLLDLGADPLKKDLYCNTYQDVYRKATGGYSYYPNIHTPILNEETA